jgi:serine/threonine protein kinase
MGLLLKSNVLINDKGSAFLADFGLSNVVAETRGPSYVTSSIGGSVRWAAPEHFRISEGSNVSTVTTYGDIYSYGSVMLQVRTMDTTMAKICTIAYSFSRLLTAGIIWKTTVPSFEEGQRSIDQTLQGCPPSAPDRTSGRALVTDMPMLGGRPMCQTKY